METKGTKMNCPACPKNVDPPLYLKYVNQVQDYVAVCKECASSSQPLQLSKQTKKGRPPKSAYRATAIPSTSSTISGLSNLIVPSISGSGSPVPPVNNGSPVPPAIPSTSSTTSGLSNLIVPSISGSGSPVPPVNNGSPVPPGKIGAQSAPGCSIHESTQIIPTFEDREDNKRFKQTPTISSVWTDDPRKFNEYTRTSQNPCTFKVNTPKRSFMADATESDKVEDVIEKLKQKETDLSVIIKAADGTPYLESCCFSNVLRDVFKVEFDGITTQVNPPSEMQSENQTRGLNFEIERTIEPNWRQSTLGISLPQTPPYPPSSYRSQDSSAIPSTSSSASAPSNLIVPSISGSGSPVPPVNNGSPVPPDEDTRTLNCPEDEQHEGLMPNTVDTHVTAQPMSIQQLQEGNINDALPEQLQAEVSDSSEDASDIVEWKFTEDGGEKSTRTVSLSGFNLSELDANILIDTERDPVQRMFDALNEVPVPDRDDEDRVNVAESQPRPRRGAVKPVNPVNDMNERECDNEDRENMGESQRQPQRGAMKPVNPVNDMNERKCGNQRPSCSGETESTVITNSRSDSERAASPTRKKVQRKKRKSLASWSESTRRKKKKNQSISIWKFAENTVDSPDTYIALVKKIKRLELEGMSLKAIVNSLEIDEQWLTNFSKIYHLHETDFITYDALEKDWLAACPRPSLTEFNCHCGRKLDPSKVRSMMQNHRLLF